MVIGDHLLTIWYNLRIKYSRVKSRFIICKIALIYREYKRSVLVLNATGTQILSIKLSRVAYCCGNRNYVVNF
nr:MAG TPA: hypothetical protein [Caudoviricetes sp.]